ncbi:uncharacterized protein LOC142228263 [Haematobia irritans]|uniref:uncharacterized protein LOC142228263 n=1 Tax=Haematobia irritans TaxID=7368 RepID=UPI003F509971
MDMDIREIPEVDENVATSIKTSLNRGSLDWEEVTEQWKKTFLLRRSELLKLSHTEFLSSWTKFAHAKAADLIEIDFEFLYPGKAHMLFSKWETFKSKIITYYQLNLNNDFCKQQLSKAKRTSNIEISIKSFDKHFRAYEVGSVKEQIQMKNINEFNTFPMHLYPINNGKVYARPKHVY